MYFSQIPGQSNLKSSLIRSVGEQRVSHAILFTGPEGCGSLALAIAFARYISCEDRKPDDSCGKCRSCLKYDKLIHPDLHFVFPVIKDKKNTDPISDSFIDQWREFIKTSPFPLINNWLEWIEVGNAQGLIYANEANEIIRKMGLKSFESDFKIMVIWLPEKMHISAANKLLKLIEEPPDKTLFLLASDDSEKIIPTIVSRCQMLKVPGFAEEDISGYLAAGLGIPAKEASDIARSASGNISRAIDMVRNKETGSQNLENFRSLMRLAWKRDIAGLMGWAEYLASTGREAQKGFIAFSLRLLRENLMLTLGQKENKIVFLGGEEESFSSNFHPFVNQNNIYPLTDELNLAFSHIEANGNAKIIFLDLALTVTRFIR